MLYIPPHAGGLGTFQIQFIFPLIAAEWPSSFAAGQKNQNPAAASAAVEVSAEAWTVQPAPALPGRQAGDAEKNVNEDSVLWP